MIILLAALVVSQVIINFELHRRCHHLEQSVKCVSTQGKLYKEYVVMTSEAASPVSMDTDSTPLKHSDEEYNSNIDFEDNCLERADREREDALDNHIERQRMLADLDEERTASEPRI